MELERLGRGHLHLALVKVDGDLLVELVDRFPLRGGDGPVDLQDRREGLLIGADREPRRLDGVMDEIGPGGFPRDLGHGVGIEVVRGIFDLDHVLELEEFPGVLLRDLEPGRVLHLLDEHVRSQGGTPESAHVVSRDERQRHARDGRINLVEGEVGGLVIDRIADVVRHEGHGAVGGGAIEFVIAQPAFLEENDVEARREPVVLLVLVEPDLDRVDPRLVVEPLDVHRLAEDDVDPSPVGHPARHGRGPAVILVGVIDPLVMLGPELVLRGVGIRIAVLPERFDEQVALPVGQELAKDLPLQRRDDIDDLLVQPFFIGGREGDLLGAEVCGENGEGGGRGDDRDQASVHG